MTKRLSDCRVTVVGLGLMGASLCMDLVQAKLCREVRGVARRSETALSAFFENAVDQATTDLHTGVAGADVVILATPVRTIVDMLAEVGPLLWPGTLVMDMGSTKGDICAAMEDLPRHVQPIGGHPMTGKETAGYEAAEPGLYRGATWVLTPLPRTSQETIDLSLELVTAVGAKPVVLEPRRHDRLVALVQRMLDLHKQLAGATLPHSKELLQRQIDATDRQIDGLVYELYGLTAEEIGVVEGRG